MGNQANRRAPDSLLDDLVDEIEQGSLGEHWNVSLDTVLLFLETSVESFYQFYYRSGHSMADLPERFSSENVRVLIEYLEYLGYYEATPLFRERGWYLTADDYLNWEEFFLSVSLSFLASHAIKDEELEISLIGCRYVADGLRFYCETEFPISSLILGTLRIYKREKKLTDAAAVQLKKYAEYLFHRRLLREETIYREFQERLRQRASRYGWIDSDPVPTPASLKEELAILGFNKMPSEETLKSSYRRLLKEVHPDLNRSGDAIRQTQNLTDAYARICAFRRERGEGVS